MSVSPMWFLISNAHNINTYITGASYRLHFLVKSLSIQLSFAMVLAMRRLSPLQHLRSNSESSLYLTVSY